MLLLFFPGVSWRPPSKPPPKRPQETPNGRQRPPKRDPRDPQEAPRDHKKHYKTNITRRNNKTLKNEYSSMKINDFWSRKIAKMSPKRSPNKKNGGKIAHHQALSLRRPKNEAQRPPKRPKRPQHGVRHPRSAAGARPGWGG